jgi:hypothetical protein
MNLLFNRKRCFASVIFALLFFESCKRDDTTQLTTNTVASKSDFQFLNSQLKQYALALSPAIKTPEARMAIRNKIKEKFDEDYEALIRDIGKLPVVKEIVDNAKIAVMHDELFNQSKERLYPQIYIPRLQYEEDMNTSTRETASDSAEEPVLVFFSGDPEIDNVSNSVVYPGYKLVNDQLVFFTMVNEQFANAHEVWVFNVNEVVDANGAYRYMLPDDEGGGGGGGGTGLGVDDDPEEMPLKKNIYPEFGRATINFKIQSMRVGVHKESWVSGASEICIRAKLHCHNDRALGDRNSSFSEHYTSDQYSNYLGKLIKKVKRKDIKNANLLTIDYSLQRDWQMELINKDPIYFDYVIFERDPWPAKLNSFVRQGRYSIIFPNDSVDNSPYHYGTFAGNILIASSANEYAGTGLVQGNGQIAFNTVLY